MIKTGDWVTQYSKGFWLVVDIKPKYADENYSSNGVEHKKGDLIGVKGRVETYNYDTENGRRYITEVVADKVTFLSSKKQG